MKADIVLAGVGGQGVLSGAALIAAAGRDDGYHVKQGEVHGMAQRGGAVHANLRLSDQPIQSDLIARGSAHILLGMEPVEALRYLVYLSPEGTLITSTEPHRNINDYPDLDEVLARMRELPRAILVETATLAREAGLAKASNVVMVGAASTFLPVKPQTYEARLAQGFAHKGARIVDANIKAFRLGREAVPCETS